MPITFTTTINELAKRGDVGQRCFNSCLSNGMDTVIDLVFRYDERDGFRHIRNCGAKTDEELTRALKMAHSCGTVSEVAKSFCEAMTLELNDLKDQIYLDIRGELGTSRELALFDRTFPSVEELIYLSFRHRIGMLDLVDKVDLGPEAEKPSIQEKFSVQKHATAFLLTLSERVNALHPQQTHTAERKALADLGRDISLTLRTKYAPEYYENLLAGDKIALIEHEFTRMFDESPRILQNFINHWEFTVHSLWQFLRMTEEEFFGYFTSRRKGATLFWQFLQTYRNYVDTIIDSSQESDRRRGLLIRYPFLSEHDLVDVDRFINQHGRTPMLMVADRYFANTENRAAQIYASCFGLGGRQKLRKIDVAQETGLTQERIRQIITDFQPSEKSLTDDPDWNHYGFDKRLLIGSESRNWREAMKEEGLEPVFPKFAGLAMLFCDFAYRRVAGVDKFLVVKTSPNRFDRYIRMLLDRKGDNHRDDLFVSVGELGAEERMDDRYLFQETLLNDVAPMTGVETIGDMFFFPRNTVDVAGEVYSMLEKEGKPMHINDILEKINAHFPELGMNKERLKFQIRNNNGILPIGKTSKYSLRKWSHVFTGSIRDLVKQMLTESTVPLDMDTIMDNVDVNFDTNRYNVYNSLQIGEDFVQFEGGRFGLKGKEYPEEYTVVDRTSHRRNFDDHFKEYKRFVDQNGHHPYTSGNEEEDRLKRWQTNVLKCTVTVAPDQLETLRHYLAATSHLPYTANEHNFKNYCDRYLRFVATNGTMPSLKSDPELAQWFKKYIGKYMDYTDNRRAYFEKLLEDLSKLPSGLF